MLVYPTQQAWCRVESPDSPARKFLAATVEKRPWQLYFFEEFGFQTKPRRANAASLREVSSKFEPRVIVVKSPHKEKNTTYVG